MFISNSVSVSDEFMGFFSSASGESNGRVIRADQDADSTSSSATLSCMKDSNEAMTDVETKRAEKTIPRINHCLGYNWVNPKVQ